MYVIYERSTNFNFIKNYYNFNQSVDDTIVISIF